MVYFGSEHAAVVWDPSSQGFFVEKRCGSGRVFSGESIPELLFGESSCVVLSTFSHSIVLLFNRSVPQQPNKKHPTKN